MQIINKPKQISLETYSVEIAKYIQQLSHCENVVSIYTMGSIKSPGLSDIDIIVVVSDDFVIKDNIFLSLDGFDKELFIHGPFVVDRYFWEKLFYLIYPTNLKLIWGKNLTIPNLSSLKINNKKELLIAQQVDFMIMRLMQWNMQINSKTIDQRRWMTILWSITHSINYLKSIGIIMSSESLIIVKSIVLLREKWNVSKRIDDKLFYYCVKKYNIIIADVFNICLDYLYSNKLKSEFPSSLYKNGLIFNFKTSNKGNVIIKNKKLWFFGKKLSLSYYSISKLYHFHLCNYNLVEYQFNEENSDNVIIKQRAVYVKQYYQWLNSNELGALTNSIFLGIDFTSKKKKSVKSKIKEFLLFVNYKMKK